MRPSRRVWPARVTRGETATTESRASWATSRTLAALVGRIMCDAFGDNPPDPTAEGVANLRASFERAPRERSARRDGAAEVRHRGLLWRKVRSEERSWRLVPVPVLDATGRVEVLIHRVWDVNVIEPLRDGTGARAGGRVGARGDAGGTQDRPPGCPQVAPLGTARRHQRPGACDPRRPCSPPAVSPAAGS